MGWFSKDKGKGGGGKIPPRKPSTPPSPKPRPTTQTPKTGRRPGPGK